MEKSITGLPNIRYLFNGQFGTTALHAAVGAYVDATSPSMKPGDFGESTQLKHMFPAAPDARSSLVDVRIAGAQPLHIHGDPDDMIEAGDDFILPSDKTCGPSARRLLILTTGKDGGQMEWFSPNGDLTVTKDTGLTTVGHDRFAAKGSAQGQHLIYPILPYSSIAVELTGGVHKFSSKGNMRIQSYHPYDVAAKPKEANARPASLSTMVWKGDRPKQPVTPVPVSAMFNLHGANEFKAFTAKSDAILTSMVDQGPQLQPIEHLATYLAALDLPFIKEANEGKITYASVSLPSQPSLQPKH